METSCGVLNMWHQYDDDTEFGAGRKMATGSSPEEVGLITWEDLEDQGQRDWRKAVRNQDKRNGLIMAAKTLGDWYKT